jgi:hypothetical protein
MYYIVTLLTLPKLQALRFLLEAHADFPNGIEIDDTMVYEDGIVVYNPRFYHLEL